MRLELTRVGLLVELANHYTTKSIYLFEMIVKIMLLYHILLEIKQLI